MNNTAIITKIKAYVLSLTHAEVISLSRQQVIDNASPALSEDEEISFRKRFSVLREKFKRSWLDTQHDNLRKNSILPALKTAKETVIADLAVVGLSGETAKKLIKQVLTEMLGVDDAV